MINIIAKCRRRVRFEEPFDVKVVFQADPREKFNGFRVVFSWDPEIIQLNGAVMAVEERWMWHGFMQGHGLNDANPPTNGLGAYSAVADFFGKPLRATTAGRKVFLLEFEPLHHGPAKVDILRWKPKNEGGNHMFGDTHIDGYPSGKYVDRKYVGGRWEGDQYIHGKYVSAIKQGVEFEIV